MKTKLPESVALNIAELYNSLNLTASICNIIIKDEQSPAGIRADCLRVTAQAKNEMAKIESRVSKDKLDSFLTQVHSEEPESFLNVRRNWFKLNDDQRSSIEDAMTYALGGYDIKLVDVNK